MPGDQDMERRIRALIRWNALAMVLRVRWLMKRISVCSRISQ